MPHFVNMHLSVNVPTIAGLFFHPWLFAEPSPSSFPSCIRRGGWMIGRRGGGNLFSALTSTSPSSNRRTSMKYLKLLSVFFFFFFSAVRWSRQTAGLHDVMPKLHTLSCVIGPWRSGWAGVLHHCGLLRHYKASRLHIRIMTSHYWSWRVF